MLGCIIFVFPCVVLTCFNVPRFEINATNNIAWQACAECMAWDMGGKNVTMRQREIWEPRTWPPGLEGMRNR